MTKLNSSIVSLLVVLVAMAAIIALTLELEFFASKLLPILISSFVILFTLIALVGELKAEKKIDAADTNDAGEANRSEAINYLVMASWIFGFFLTIYLVGFMIASPLFVGAYMKRHGSSWLETLITMGVFTVIFYSVFNIALQADLYKGNLHIWLGF